MPETVLMLWTCPADMTAHGGFRWPESGPVEAPDWDPEPNDGGGLYGLPGGRGDYHCLSMGPNTRWLVWEAQSDEMRNFGCHAKAPRGTVVYCGDRDGAVQYLLDHGYSGVPWSRVTVGNYSQATVGHEGCAVAGHFGTATAGNRGAAEAGRHGTASAGDFGRAEAGVGGTATVGYGGCAVAGEHGRASAGGHGCATAGDYGIATVDSGGSAAAGEGGQIAIRWRDDDANRYRLAIGYVGEDGILPDVAYRCDDRGRLVRADGQR